MDHLIRSCANILVRALNQLEQGDMTYQQQADLELMMGPVYSTFPLAPPEVKAKAKQRLIEGTYKHLVKQ